MKKKLTDSATDDHNGNSTHKDKILEATILTMQIQTLHDDRCVFEIESNITRIAWKSMFNKNADFRQPAQEYISRLCDMIKFNHTIVSDEDLEVLLDHGQAYVEVELHLMKEKNLRQHNPMWRKISPNHARHALRNNPRSHTRTWMLTTDQRHARTHRGINHAAQ